MEKKGFMQFVIYSRKSKFTGKGESIGNQIELCREYIATHYSKEEAEAARVYEDEGFSGGTLERPQFQQMMKDSRDIQFSAIVVYRLDRISRNIGDFAKLIEDLGNRNIDFISIREQFDTSSPMGRAMMYIASVFSQLERETIAERIRDNMYELAKTGRWLGGTTPTGYQSESVSTMTVDGKTRKACKLKMIPDEVNLVKLIYDKFLEVGSLTAVDEFLMNGHYQTKRGKRFSRFAIKGILTNPVYMIADEDAYQYLIENDVDLFSENEAFDGRHGIMAYNRTLQRPHKTAQKKPINEWVVSVGKHIGIIPGSTWVRVQKMLELNRSKSYRKPRSNVALLSGLLYCGKCGDYMRPKMTNRLTATGEPIYTYLCSTKERSHSHICDMKNANGNMLDKKIVAEIKKLRQNGDTMAKMITQTKRKITGNKEGYEAELTKVKEEIANNEKDIKKLVDMLITVGQTSAEQHIIQKIDELHEEGEQLKRRMSELESIISEHELADDEFDLIRHILSNIGNSIDQYTVEQKRAAIRTFVRKIVWDGENVHLYLFNSDGDYDFPSPPTGGEGPNKKPRGSGKSRETPDGSDEPLGEDSKRDSHALPCPEEAAGGGVPHRDAGVGRGWELPLADGCDCSGRRHAGGAGHPRRLREGAGVCPDLPVAPGEEDHHPALWTGRPGPAYPAGDCRPVRHQPVVCIPH